MGNALEKPITEKNTSSEKLETLSWGVTSMQGWRISNEDAHICQTTRLPPAHYLFGVFDGHGGEYAAEYCRDHFVSILLQQESFQIYQKQLQHQQEGKGNTKSKKKSKSNKAKKLLEEALQETFVDVDQQLPILLKQADSSSTNKALKKKSKSNKGNTRAIKRQDEKTEQQLQLLERALQDSFVDIDRRLLKDLIDRDMYQHPSDSNAMDNDQDLGDDWGEFAEVEKALPTSSDTIYYSQNHKGDNIPGCTATVVLITPQFVLCANAGDSRAVLADSTGVKALSKDHKPDLPEEKERIEKANGNISFDSRVDGELAVSRALGDFGFKEYHRYPPNSTNDDDDQIIDDDKRQLAKAFKVTPFPDIFVHVRDNESDRILIVACDGVWDVMKNSYCLELVDTLMTEGESDMGLVAEEVSDHCLKRGSRDNITMIVVKFLAQKIGMGGGVSKRRVRDRKI